MGCCCSCSGGKEGEDEGAVVSETEMREQELANRKVLAIARGMSAPSIDVQDYNKVRCVVTRAVCRVLCAAYCVNMTVFLGFVRVRVDSNTFALVVSIFFSATFGNGSRVSLLTQMILGLIVSLFVAGIRGWSCTRVGSVGARCRLL